MGIWKDLTQPDSFVGEYDTVVEAPSPVERSQHFNGSSTQVEKRDSIIGPGVVIDGKIQADGDLRMAGSVKGDVQVKGILSIEPGGRIVGAVSADRIVIGGEVEGNIQATSHVQLLETGRLLGDLKAKFFAAAAGSRMRGKVEFGWDEPEAKMIENKASIEKSETKPFL
jgi:cytoskeletal protein CcmA (bactofilin family)